jgi:hypothetical protein
MKLFNEQYGWYKGNLHTHTTISDGKKTPEECLKIYEDQGYDFISLTDHWAIADNPGNADILVLKGCEYDFFDKDKRSTCHIVAIGIQSALKKADHLTSQHAIDDIKRQGGISIIAHPHWSYMSTEELLRLKEYDGVEIYNSLCGVERYTGDGSAHIDAISIAGATPILFAADDTHRYTRELFKGFVMVNSPTLTTDDIMENIRKGNFYCSQGPKINQIEVDDKYIRVETSPLKHIIFHPDSSWTGRTFFAEKDQYLTEAVFEIHPLNRSIRIQGIDEKGNMVWSQHIKIK